MRRFKRRGEPTEAALKVLVEKLGIPGESSPDRSEERCHYASDHWAAMHPRLESLEFSRGRKSMSVLCKPASGGRRTRHTGNNVL